MKGRVMRVDERMSRMKLWILMNFIERNECLEKGDGLGSMMLSDEITRTWSEGDWGHEK
jgi:hypothetical protein